MTTIGLRLNWSIVYPALLMAACADDVGTTRDPDGGSNPADAATSGADARPDGPADAGVADAVAAPDVFAPWHIWDGTYTLEWEEKSRTCTPGIDYLPYWAFVDLENVDDAPPTADGEAQYRRDSSTTCCAWSAARVTSDGHATVDGVAVWNGSVSPCSAVQTTDRSFECDLTRHAASGDPVGPCDVTWQVRATRL